jgi:hypothetical protein
MWTRRKRDWDDERRWRYPQQRSVPWSLRIAIAAAKVSLGLIIGTGAVFLFWMTYLIVTADTDEQFRKEIGLGIPIRILPPGGAPPIVSYSTNVKST